MIIQIEYCKECGLQANDIEDGLLRGIGSTCVSCGALEDWLIECECGNDNLYNMCDDEAEYALPNCPDCGAFTLDANISYFDSAYVIQNVLNRPDLHKKRTWIPASFVDTLIKSLVNPG